MDLSEILDDKPVEKPAPEKVEDKAETKPEAETAEKPEVEHATSRRAEHRKRELEAQGRDPETGQFVKKDEEKKPEEKVEAKPEAKPAEKAPPPPKEELTAKEKAAFAAAADERRKRQALEAELARYRQPAPAQPGVQPQPKSFWDDPEGAFKTEEQKRHEQAASIKIQVSEMLARSKHEDFDEKVAKFVELAKTTPGLGQQMLASPDPAGFAYQTAKNHILIEQAGGVDKLMAEREAKARAEERAKVEAEFKAKAEEAERQRAALPQSLSGATGAGRRPAAQTWTGPVPLEEILKG